MPQIKFLPMNQVVDVADNSKILLAAIRSKIPIRYGCASCRCGTCAVSLELQKDGALSPMEEDEKKLLDRMKLPTDGTVRLACRARVQAGLTVVDLGFQNSYSPDQGELG